MLVNPSDAEVVHTPSLFPASGASRHFTRAFTLAASAANQEFGIKLRPSLHDFISFQAGNTAIAFAAADTLVATLDFHGFDQSAGEIYVQRLAGAATALVREGCAPVSSDGFLQFAWTTTTVGLLNTIVVRNQSPLPVFGTVRAYHTGGTTDYNISVAGADRADITAALSSGANTWTGIGVKGPLTLDIVDANVISVPTNSTTQSFFSDSLVSQGQIERYRVTAMSMLCSYRGNLLENAGVIAAARAPSSWAPRKANMFDSIAELVNYSYKGPLINGAYCWWLPNDIKEIDYSSPGALYDNDTTSLYAGGVFTDLGGALEIIVDVVVEFYSPLQIFERQHFPPLTDEYVQMYYHLSCLPAATCNPSHLEILKKGVKAAARAGMAGINWAKANPEYVTLLLKGLSAIAM
jgi:hypothetical protein